jgi:hypothetical protein
MNIQGKYHSYCTIATIDVVDFFCHKYANDDTNIENSLQYMEASGEKAYNHRCGPSRRDLGAHRVQGYQ